MFGVLVERFLLFRLLLLLVVVMFPRGAIVVDVVVGTFAATTAYEPKNNPQFMTQNIVNQMARKNTKCYSLRQQSSGKPIQREEAIPQSEVYKNSFFPRTTREWNNLEDNIATAESIETFKKRLSTLSSSNYIYIFLFVCALPEFFRW